MKWLVMVVWCFKPTYYYINFQYAIVQWKIIFEKLKRPQIHLLMSFNSIIILAGYIFWLPKIRRQSDWWWLLGVSSQNIVIFTFNMLLFDETSFFRSQNFLKLIYLWASGALELWLDIYFDCQKWRCGLTGDCCLVFPAKLLLYLFSIWCCLMENYFSEVKNTSNAFTYELH